MRRLLHLLLAMCLVAGFLAGSAARASDVICGGAVAEAAEWLHYEGEGDQVPADAHKNAPHHHSTCHGHELAAAFRMRAEPLAAGRDPVPAPAPVIALASIPPDLTLRPPIA